MRALLVLFILLLAMGGCADTLQLREEPSSSVDVPTTEPTVTVRETNPIPAASPDVAELTPGVYEMKVEAMIASLPTELQSMVIVGYPWEYEEERELHFNHSGDIEPVSVRIQPNDQPAFTHEDMIAGALRYGMPLEEAMEFIELPRDVYCYYSPMTGEDWFRLYFDNGNELEFLAEYEREWEFRLHEAQIKTGFAGPRGIQIGDTIETVIESFQVHPTDFGESVEVPGWTTLYAKYLYPYQGYEFDPPNSKMPLAPYGVIESSEYYRWEAPEESTSYVRYAYTKVPYTLEEVESGKTEYSFLPVYFLSFSIQDGKVTEYRWSQGVSA